MTFERVEKGLDDGELEDEANEVESEKDEATKDTASDSKRFAGFALRPKPLSRQNDGELAADGAIDQVKEPDSRTGSAARDRKVVATRAADVKAAWAAFVYTHRDEPKFVEPQQVQESFHLVEMIRRGLVGDHPDTVERASQLDTAYFLGDVLNDTGLNVMSWATDIGDSDVQRSERGAVMYDEESLTIDRKKSGKDGDGSHQGSARIAAKSHPGIRFDSYRDQPAAERKASARRLLNDIIAKASTPVYALGLMYYLANATAEKVGKATGAKGTQASARGSLIAKLLLDAVDKVWEHGTTASYRDVLDNMENSDGVSALRLKVQFEENDRLRALLAAPKPPDSKPTLGWYGDSTQDTCPECHLLVPLPANYCHGCGHKFPAGMPLQPV